MFVHENVLKTCLYFMITISWFHLIYETTGATIPDSLDTTNYRRRAEDDSDNDDEDSFSSIARVGGSLVDFGKANKDHDVSKEEASQETRDESDSERNNDDNSDSEDKSRVTRALKAADFEPEDKPKNFGRHQPRSSDDESRKRRKRNIRS